jgi:transcriptional regulator NrdR family protein
VRFASVYRNFTEAREFSALLDEISGDGREPAVGEAGRERD